MKTQLPVQEQEVDLRMDSRDLVCHVKAISSAQQLSFHYGTTPQPYGTLATFRLIGDGFEIELYNPEKQNIYSLSLYESPPGKGADRRARAAYDRFKAALLKPPAKCAS